MRHLVSFGLVVASAACVLPDYNGAGDGGGGASAGSSFPSGSTGIQATSGEPASSGTDGSSTSSDASSTSSDASSTSSDASSTSSDASSTSSAVASSSTGTDPCLPALPPCADATPFDFANQRQLDMLFDVDQAVAKETGGKLRLDPEGDEAVLKSKDEVGVSSDCAVWVRIHDSDAMGATGIGFGNGSLSGSPLRIERRGNSLSAVAGGAVQASRPFIKEETSFLRLRAQAGQIHLDYSGDSSCWENLSGPHSAGETKVILFHEGSGKADLDDYCLD